MEPQPPRALFESNYVTDRNYYLDPAIRRKLDFLCLRCSAYKHQNVMITDGKEGYGKSTITAAHAYYMAWQLKRKLRLFFKTESLSEDAKKNKEMIYIWDDAAISALTLEAYNREILKFIKVLLLARKRRHSYFINIQEVFRLKEPIVARASGLTRVYSVDRITLGRFAHFLEDPLQKLYFEWIHKKRKSYNKYYNLRGYFPDVLYDIFDEKEYERLKDEAIESIGVERTKERADRINPYRVRYDMMRNKIYEMTEKFGINQQKLAKHFNTNSTSISMWKYAGGAGDVQPLNFHQQRVINKKDYIEPKVWMPPSHNSEALLINNRGKK